eukprot:gene8313-biopygen6729
MESHEDGGVHFHMCVLLDKLQRWSKVKKHLQETKDIVVHFSGHPGYRTAYEYVTKLDSQVLRSEGHPTLKGAPKTLPAMKKRSRTSASGMDTTQKSTRLGNLKVSDMIISNGIDSKLHFLALAKKKKTDGDSRLYEFVLNKGEKRISELVQSVWAMETAQQTLERRSISRIDLLKKAYNDKCVCQEMMDIRWKYFSFRHQFKASEQKMVTPCGWVGARYQRPEGGGFSGNSDWLIGRQA